MKNLVKCTFIGYGFLAVITVLETLLMGFLVGLTAHTLVAHLCIGTVIAIFNASIWSYAMNYHRTKERLDHTTDTIT